MKALDKVGEIVVAVGDTTIIVAKKGETTVVETADAVNGLLGTAAVMSRQLHMEAKIDGLANVKQLAADHDTDIPGLMGQVQEYNQMMAQMS